MKPIEGWNDVEPIMGTSFPTLPPGGYICKVVTAREELSKKSGKRMLVLAIDIADGEHKDFFLNQYQNRKKSNEKATWGAGGIYRQVVEGDSIGRFKGMITSFEMSNKDWKWNWDESSLIGLEIGGLFREEEYIGQQDGKLKTSVKCIALLPVEGIENEPVPEKKCLEQSAFGGFTQQGMTDDIPF